MVARLVVLGPRGSLWMDGVHEHERQRGLAGDPALGMPVVTDLVRDQFGPRQAGVRRKVDDAG